MNENKLLLDNQGYLESHFFLHLGGINRCLIFGNGICPRGYNYDFMYSSPTSKDYKAVVTNVKTGHKTEETFSRRHAAKKWLWRSYNKIQNKKY